MTFPTSYTVPLTKYIIHLTRNGQSMFLNRRYGMSARQTDPQAYIQTPYFIQPWLYIRPYVTIKLLRPAPRSASVCRNLPSVRPAPGCLFVAAPVGDTFHTDTPQDVTVVARLSASAAPEIYLSHSSPSGSAPSLTTDEWIRRGHTLCLMRVIAKGEVLTSRTRRRH